MGCYGYERNTTPNLDRFASDAVIFENAIAPGQWTIPVHASLFTGEPPSSHLTVQAEDALSDSLTTLAEYLDQQGYRTIGFCNNPLVGILNNGFKRGFQSFINYCGAVPESLPRDSGMFPFIENAWRQTKLLFNKHVMMPIQETFGQNSQAFLKALNPFWVPLWIRFANFKGKTAPSIRDVNYYLQHEINSEEGQPHFVFFNLMETHLPFTPPDRFIRKFAPRMLQDRKARQFMRNFNSMADRWLVPLESPFTDLEAQIISDMYDAEVAYQDHLLGSLLDTLSQPEHRENTLVILVSDHGEMLGEHQFMGHGFGVYQELVHVPLIVRFPTGARTKRIAEQVSITRLFHTVLDFSGISSYTTTYNEAVDTADMSLKRLIFGEKELSDTVISEAYAPNFALSILENNIPKNIEKFHCRSTYRALYDNGHKFVDIENIRQELYDLKEDAGEMNDLSLSTELGRVQRLSESLEQFVVEARTHVPEDKKSTSNLSDELVQQRLRDLGYLE
jgi:arylsulfatase A-like enzyme